MMQYYFYKTNGKSVKDLVKIDNKFTYEITFDSDNQQIGILSYKNSEIELINKDSKPNLFDEPLFAFRLNTVDTSILSILFEKYQIYFYGDFANEMTKLLKTNNKNDEKYYYALLHNYIAESMLYQGVIRDEIELGEDFLNPELTEKSLTIISRRYRWLMIKEMFNIIINKIKSFFKKIFHKSE